MTLRIVRSGGLRMAHTPKRWFVRDFRAVEMARLGWRGPCIDRILIVDRTGPEIIESGDENCVVARIQFDNRTELLGENNLADAYMLAAAPALYEALKAALGCLGTGGCTERARLATRKQIRAALKSAATP